MPLIRLCALRNKRRRQFVIEVGGKMDYTTTVVCTIVALFVALYWYVGRKYRYWSDRNIDGPRPTFLFGNNLAKTAKSAMELESELLKKYGRVYGTYHGVTPALVVADNQLIKQILIKDFPSFINRRLSNTFHEIWNLNLFNNQEHASWKRIRSITSPTFTSGKLKSMMPLMEKCTVKLVNRLEKLAEAKGSVMDVREEIAAFTIDVIATTSFGLEIDSHIESEQRKAFVKHGLELFQINPIKAVIGFTLPSWALSLLGIQVLFGWQHFNFFLQLMKNVLCQRRNVNVTRNDLVQLMMNAYLDESELNNINYDKLTATANEGADVAESKDATKNKKFLNDNEIIAQCMIFFVAGFETTAATISHCLYNLALYPKVQERLYAEIEQLSEIEDKEEYYKQLMSSPYLDAVVHETLRLYPPVTRTERRLNADSYEIAGVKIDKGTEIELPIYAIHHCEEYYPDPERFDPERFMPENRHLLKPHTYLPFGDGPRNCIGMRFAYQEIKILLGRVVPRFIFAKCPETEIPLKVSYSGLLMGTRNIKIRIEKRR